MVQTSTETEPSFQDIGEVELKRPSRPRKAVYTIIESENSNYKGRWVRMGTAYTNRDSSLTVYLDGLPINGKLHIRDMPDNPSRSS